MPNEALPGIYTLVLSACGVSNTKTFKFEKASTLVALNDMPSNENGNEVKLYVESPSTIKLKLNNVTGKRLIADNFSKYDCSDFSGSGTVMNNNWKIYDGVAGEQNDAKISIASCSYLNLNKTLKIESNQIELN
jgi:hypothetical protein